MIVSYFLHFWIDGLGGALITMVGSPHAMLASLWGIIW
jgi:hypothetical protein